MATNNTKSLTVIKQELFSPAIQENIKARLGAKSATFVTSLLDLFGDDKNLQACDPKLVVKEALKAAALDLPINRNLGFAYVLPYKDGKSGVYVPQFQMGYKGFVQLAIRTGQYRHLNAGIVYEGEEIIEDRIRGKIEIGGEKKSEKAIGYFAYMELLNGFNKAVAWPRARVEAHAKRFSKAYGKGFSPWSSDFDAMAMKTMLLQLVPKYGPLSLDMATALSSERDFDSDTAHEIDQNANQEIIDIPKAEPDQEPEGGSMTDEEKAAIMEQEAAEAAMAEGPGY